MRVGISRYSNLIITVAFKIQEVKCMFSVISLKNVKYMYTCTDPEIFSRGKGPTVEFAGGGGGGYGAYFR